MAEKNLDTTYDFSLAKEEYRYFCENEANDIQIFAQPWYLDAVCESPDDWRVILVKRNEKIVAAFPFEYKKGKKGMWSIHNPWQAPRLGVWLDYGTRSSEDIREAFENKVISEIIRKLPYFDIFQIAFDSRFKNWHQFYREGFLQSTQYSYIVKPEKIENYIITLNKSKRRQVNLGLKEYEIQKNILIDNYWNFFLFTYKKRNRKPSYHKQQFYKLAEAVEKHGVGLSYAAYKEDIAYGMIYCVFDGLRTYNMLGTFDPNSSISPQPVLTYTAIMDALSSGRIFDFEGSMIPGVALFNSEFNAVKEPYFVITKYSSKYRFLNGLRESASALKELVSGAFVRR